jgi:HPt (histidine-containing phosphotransfer) domain-containing protein
VETTGVLFDKEAFLDVLDNDEELLREIVADYLADSQRILTEIAALLASAGNGDDYELRRLVHTLKGSSANLHAQLMREAAIRLEHAIKQQEPVDLSEVRCALQEFTTHVRQMGLVSE